MCPLIKRLVPLIEFEIGATLVTIVLLGYGVLTGKFEGDAADTVRDMLYVFSFSATVLNAVIACILVFCRRACDKTQCKNKNT